MDLMNKALYGGIIPGGLALMLALISLLTASRGSLGRRLAAWVVPVAGAAGMFISFHLQFRPAVPERWTGIVTVSAALLLVWVVAVTLWPATTRRLALVGIPAILVIAAVGGSFMLPTFYDRQDQWLRAIPFLAAAVLAASLYPLAIRDAKSGDAIAVALAGGLLTPIVLFAGTGKFSELLVTAPVAAGGAGVLALSLRQERFAQWRHGICAGAIGVVLIYPMYALIAWGNSYDLPRSHAWALLLPCAAVLAIWVSRMPGLSRKPLLAGILAIACVAGVAAAGFAMAYREADTAAYDPGF